nr:retrovirus-related Pol polyprotein from transposon TNT 1-94 [Tanacetum cinerariifolium]
KTVPRTPQQNGVVERRSRTLIEAARTMLIFSKALMFLWAEAVATACYTQNRSLIHTRHHKTPYELVHNEKHNLIFFRVFGALCYPTNDIEDLGKLQLTADVGIFVGYAPSSKGYRIYNKRTRRIMETIYVHLDELTKQTASVHLESLLPFVILQTSPGSPHHQPPPPPPPAGPSGASRAPGASGSSQEPPPPPPPSSTNQESPSKGSAAPSSTKTTASDMGPDEHAQLSDDEDIESSHIPKVNLRQDWWKPLEEERHTGDIAIFIEWFCMRRGITELKPQDLEGPAFKIVKYDIAAMYGISHWWFQRQRFYIDRHTSEGDRRAVRTHIRILSVVRIEVFSTYGYHYMKKVVLRLVDLNEHVIAERDFKAVMFRDKYGVQMMMRFNEIHKFGDGTLQQIDEALDYRVKEFRINKMNPEALEDKEDLSQPGELCWWTPQRGRLHTFKAYRMIKSFWHSRPLSDDFEDGNPARANIKQALGRGQGTNPRCRGAAGYGGAQNIVGKDDPGQARQIKCYNCNGLRHIARNCTQPKHPHNFDYFKDKMLLMQAQENRVALNEEHLLFLAGGHDNTIDEDVYEQPVQNLALNVDNVFQADDGDAFDSDVDEAPMAQNMFMKNLSSAIPVYDEAGPSYDSDILSEYVKDNTVPGVHINVSSVPNDAYMMIYNDMYEPHAQSVSKTSQNTAVENSLTAKLATYKKQVELVGNANPGQARQVKCYNYNSTGHIARNCTQPKQPQNSEYYKDKMLLMQAQENEVALDEEQLLFLAADDCNAFDSDVDEASTIQTMFMANMSFADPITDEAGPSYDSDVLSKVQDHDRYQDAVCAHHEEHVMHDSVQLKHVVDSHADYTSNSNMIPYDQRPLLDDYKKGKKINDLQHIMCGDMFKDSNSYLESRGSIEDFVSFREMITSQLLYLRGSSYETFLFCYHQIGEDCWDS